MCTKREQTLVSQTKMAAEKVFSDKKGVAVNAAACHSCGAIVGMLQFPCSVAAFKAKDSAVIEKWLDR